MERSRPRLRGWILNKGECVHTDFKMKRKPRNAAASQIKVSKKIDWLLADSAKDLQRLDKLFKIRIAINRLAKGQHSAAQVIIRFEQIKSLNFAQRGQGQFRHFGQDGILDQPQMKLHLNGAGPAYHLDAGMNH